MTQKYLVRTYMEGRTIKSRRPIFNTVFAESADEACSKIRESIIIDNSNAQIKKITATPLD